MKQHGDTVAGKKIEIIRKDIGGAAPDVAKRLAQELVVRDNVDILARLRAHAERARRRRRLGAGEEVHGDHERRDLDHHDQVAVLGAHLGDAAAGGGNVRHLGGDKSGIKKSYTMVTDYGPGHDFEAGFQRAFKEAGGEIIGSVRFPVANPDFSAFVQRAKDLNPESIMHLHSGRRAAGGARQGVRRARRRSEQDQDPGLGRDHRRAGAQEHGRRRRSASSRRGTTTTRARRRATSQFVKLFNEMHERNPDFFSIGGYDGMHVIYEALKKTGGKTDGDALIAAAKGLKWESPRGPMSIDPETRDVVQTIYIRRVQKVGGELVNVPFDKVENVKDPVKARGG